MTIKFRATDKNIFNAVCSGKKSVETRAATPKYQDVEPGDKLTFTCTGSSCQKIVKTVHYFSSVDALLAYFPPESINPELETVQEIEEMYSSFPGYKNKIETYGLAAWELSDN